MSVPTNPADPPMAEPGKRPSGGDVGGVAAAAQPGVADWAQRSTDRGEDAALGRASPGDATGASTERDSASAVTGAGAKRAAPAARAEQDDDAPWRHAPVAPVDEPNVLRSLGKAIGDTVTGSGQDQPDAPKR